MQFAGGNQILKVSYSKCVWKVRLKFLSTHNNNINNKDADDAWAMTIVLQTFMFRRIKNFKHTLSAMKTGL